MDTREKRLPVDVDDEMEHFEGAMKFAYDYVPARNPFEQVSPHPEEAYASSRDSDRFMGWCMAMQAAAEAFQSRVQPWMMECFGAEISADRMERNHRFFEEASELVQACGMTASEAHQLVDYTWGRTIGERNQEVGGVIVTLAALCLANSLDMHAAGEAELARISAPETMTKIRAKQAAKPKHSPLPEAPEVGKISAPDIILTGAQLLEALEFIAPDRATDPDQLDSEVAFAYGEGHGGKAMYVWCAEYPEERSFVCDGSSVTTVPTQAERKPSDEYDVDKETYIDRIPFYSPEGYSIMPARPAQAELLKRPEQASARMELSDDQRNALRTALTALTKQRLFMAARVIKDMLGLAASAPQGDKAC